MNFRVEKGQVGDGSTQAFFIVKCDGCGYDVWINTVTRDPRERTYFCVRCKTIVPQSIIDEIVCYIDTNKGCVKPT